MLVIWEIATPRAGIVPSMPPRKQVEVSHIIMDLVASGGIISIMIWARLVWIY